MKNICICTLVALALFIAGCTSGESYTRADVDFNKIDKVAVIDVQGDIRGELAKNQIADFFTMELLKRGYKPVERAQVKSLLKEHDFQWQGLTPQEDAVQAGRILNVPTVLIVNIQSFKEQISLTAKMLDIEDGSILWLGSGTGKVGRTLSTLFGAATGVGAGVAVAGEDGKVLGGIAGGLLGAAAGQALAPQTAEKVQEIIKKMCQSLPYRSRKK